jgi:hypothetical protein
MTPEEARAKILADPNTARIAKELSIPLEEYVNMVLHFAMNPGAEPELVMASDEDLRAHGFNPPSIKEVENYLEEVVEVSGVYLATEYNEAAPKPPVSLPQAPAATADDSQSSPELKDELARTLKKSRGEKV